MSALTPPPATGAAEPAPAYAAPAVEKALDILEFLAGAGSAVSQLQIAQHTGRSAAQIFRVLSVLERRGYIARDPDSGLYALTLQLFDLAHRHDPIRSLVWLAQPIMRELAASVEQSCNLGYRTGQQLTVLAEAAGPGDFGFRVRVGAEFDLHQTNAGDVLLAFAAEAEPGPVDPAIAARLAAVRAAGFAQRPDGLYPGITDLSYPILGRDGTARACLTVPYVATSLSAHHTEFVREQLAAAAERISTLLAGEAVPAASAR